MSGMCQNCGSGMIEDDMLEPFCSLATLSLWACQRIGSLREELAEARSAACLARFTGANPPGGQRMIHDFINDIAKAWSVDTCVAPDEWTPERPAVGQCAVTALLVQEILGGEILRCEITDGSHYWNRLENGVEIDLTAGQFEEAIERRNVESRTREQLLASLSTRVRFERLRQTYSDNGSSNSLLIQNEHRKGDE